MGRVPTPEESAEIRHASWAADKMKEHGWYAHFVPLTQHYMNAHTHGVAESFKHPDFQVVLGMSPERVHPIFATLVEKVKGGLVFVDGCDYDDVVANGYKIRVIQKEECGRPVLRVLIPDQEGRFPGEGCNELFEGQESFDTDDHHTETCNVPDCADCRSEVEFKRNQLQIELHKKIKKTADGRYDLSEIQVEFGDLMDTDEAAKEFELLQFYAPYVVVKRRSDGVMGTLLYLHNPRFYFGWQEA